MKELFNFINENAIVASLIILVITTIIQISFRKSDRRYNEKQDSKREKRKQFENKAELIIDNNIEDDGLILCIYLFMTSFNVKVVNNKKDVEFYYPKDIGNKNKYKHLIFYIKNIGKADINEIYLCATAQ